MKLKTTLIIICISGIMAFCTACSGLPEASGDDVPEAAVHQSALPASPATTGSNEPDEKMALVRARARANAANFILSWYIVYEDNPEYIGRFYVGEDYMLHVQLSEVTDEAKEALNAVFDDFAEVVVYESFDAPVTTLKPDYILHQEFFYSSGQ